MAIHQTGFSTILVNTNRLKKGTRAFHPAWPALLKSLNQEIQTAITVNPDTESTIIIIIHGSHFEFHFFEDDLNIDRFIETIVEKNFAGPAYYWMFPFKKYLIKVFRKNHANLDNIPEIQEIIGVLENN